MSDSEKKYYTIGSIVKVCSLLEKLSEKQGWEVTELSRAMDMPKTTVHRMLLTLEDEGFVIQEKRGGTYSLSYKLFSLGRRVLNYTNLVDISRPYTNKLCELFDETTNFCMPSGIDMLILDKKSTSQALRPDNIVGSSFPIFYSASGKALLAFTPEPQKQALLEKIKEETCPHISAKSYAHFLEELKEIENTGLAYDNEEIFPGVRCLAVPIFDLQNIPVAAVSISAPTIRLTRVVMSHMEKALLEVCVHFSQQLGSQHPFFDKITHVHDR